MLLAFAGAVVAPASATARPAIAATTVVTATGTGGIAAYVPRDVRVRDDGTSLMPAGVSISRRGGSYAFVGLSQPDVCRAARDPLMAMCMTVHAYDFGALHDAGTYGDDLAYYAVMTDPPILYKGRLDIYVITDGVVTVTLRFSGTTGATRLRAERPITGWMTRLPQHCPAGPCDVAGYGGTVRDVGSRGFVASFATAVRQVRVGPDTPAGYVPDPGTQFSTSCIYPRTGSRPVSPEPKDHPTGCDLHPLSDDTDWPDHYLSFAGALSPLNTGGGRMRFDYAAKGRVYVGYTAGVASTVSPEHDYYGYGVWLREGIR